MPEVSFPFCTRWDDRNRNTRLLGSVEDDSRGETYASIRLLKGKRKKKERKEGRKIQQKKGKQSPGRGIEL